MPDSRRQQAAELAREIHRNARMHGALLVEESLRPAGREHALVPGVRMDIEAAAAVETKAHEVFGFDIGAGQSQWHQERSCVERKEQLTTIMEWLLVIAAIAIVWSRAWAIAAIRRDIGSMRAAYDLKTALPARKIRHRGAIEAARSSARYTPLLLASMPVVPETTHPARIR